MKKSIEMVQFNSHANLAFVDFFAEFWLLIVKRSEARFFASAFNWGF